MARTHLAVSLLIMAVPLAARGEEVRFRSGDLLLAGTLSIPSGEGPFAGLVIVHGSGTSSRSNAWTSAYAQALVERGVAVLYPDKRGSGASEGNWQVASFEDLAEDALAAAALLREQLRVDATRVGLIGFSQGGHIVPLAAARSPEVAFVIDVSGSVLPIVEQIGDEIQQMGRKEGLGEEELAKLAQIHELSVRHALRGDAWEPYAQALAAAKAEAMGRTHAVQGFPTDRDAPQWEFLRTIGNFDPLPYWREIDVPVLFLYGGQDENVDVARSAAIIHRELTPAGVDFGFLLMSRAGHGIFREDCMDFVARWVRP